MIGPDLPRKLDNIFPKDEDWREKFFFLSENIVSKVSNALTLAIFGEPIVKGKVFKVESCF